MAKKLGLEHIALSANAQSSASGPSATSLGEPSMSACRGDCVAKLFAALPTRNYRIRKPGISDPNCALWLILESILRVGSLENSFATQSEGEADVPQTSADVRVLTHNGSDITHVFVFAMNKPRQQIQIAKLSPDHPA